MKVICLSLTLLLCCTYCFSQTIDEATLKTLLDYREPQLMADKEEQMLNIYTVANDEAKKKIYNILNTLSTSNDLYLQSRSLAWKGVVLSRPPFNKVEEAYSALQQSLTKAVQTGDEYLMQQVFELYGSHCRSFGNPELALFYYLKSADLRKKLGDQYFSLKNNQLFARVGDQLFRMQEYDKAIEYLQLAINTPVKGTISYPSNMNTIGLAYQRSNRFDSALYWYQRAVQEATLSLDTVWQGIVNGNIGALYFEQGQYNKALPMLWKDYEATIKVEPNSAGNTLHRIALIYLYTGKMDSALTLARKSFQIVSNYPFKNWEYIRNSSFTLSQVFRKNLNIDSAYFYTDFYHRVNDSLNQVTARNRADVVQTKLEFEKTASNIKLLQQEKEAEKIKRNFLTAFILVLLITGWFYFRWQKQESRNRQQKLLHQKQLADAEVNNARQQLQEFTQHVIDKNELIEKLEQQLAERNLTTNENLLNQTILTENDWLRFKDMFEKANPGFITQLKKIAPDITTAELRLATLIKLNIGNKHIASMLGTTTDAVRKTKSRLRQRLQIGPEEDLDDFILSIQV